jgi:hypothetical protein
MIESPLIEELLTKKLQLRNLHRTPAASPALDAFRARFRA